MIQIKISYVHHLTRINATARNRASAIRSQTEETMLDTVILTAIPFFVLFGVGVLVIDWINRRGYNKRR